MPLHTSRPRLGGRAGTADKHVGTADKHVGRAEGLVGMEVGMRSLPEDEARRRLDELGEDARRIIAKYRLRLSRDLVWTAVKENAFDRKIFRHEFARQSDAIGLLFRVNSLCAAKVSWFRENARKFEGLKCLPDEGLVAVPWWDAEILRHLASGTLIDLRFLQSIDDIEEFHRFTAGLEGTGVLRKAVVEDC